MLNNITVLLTGAGAPGAPGIIKCFRKVSERRIRIIGVDMNPYPSGRALVDSFYPIPCATSEDFIDSVLNICIKERVDIVIPIVTRELIKFAESKDLFLQHNILVSVLEKDVLEIVNDKAKLLTMLKKKGIQTPDYRVINDVVEFPEACHALGYPEKPLCIKQTQGNGSRGIRFIDASKSRYEMFLNEKPNSMYISFEEMESILKERDSIPQLIIMEYLPGVEYSVDLLADKGKTEMIVGRYNSKVISSIPIESILEYRENVVALSKRIVSEMNLSGNIGIDFRYDLQGFPQIMEINPRLTATIVASAAAGINFPYLGIKQLLGEPLKLSEIAYDGTRMVRRWQEVFYDQQGDEISF
jgi:carbamoyl-phosphate synthase large subunit